MKNIATPLALLFVLVILTACGGSGGSSGSSADNPSGQCVTGVKTGFAGDPNRNPDRGGNGHGPSGSAGSAGAGGGLGKVLRGVVRVTRLDTGALVGEAVTDNDQGLVTITICENYGPLLVTLKGQVGAKYFDEGKNALVDFSSDQELHALVDALDENIGVSSFTEAAYRYAVNNYLPKKAGAPPLLKSADVTGLTANQVTAANKVVLDALNRALPSAYHLQSLKALPTPIAKDSSTDAVPTSRYGLAAIVSGGFVRMAGQYKLDAELPALQATEELARDLTDGKIDGFALDGSASSQGTLPTYDSVRLPIALSVGANSVADQFSQTQNFATAPGVAEVVNFFKYEPDCTGYNDDVALMKDSSVNLFRTFDISGGGFCTAGNRTTLVPGFPGDVKQVVGMGPRAFLATTNGDVFAWGDATCGMLGDGQRSGYVDKPELISGIHNATSLSAGTFFMIARDGVGDVYSWGVDYNDGALGLGAPPSDTCTLYTGGGFPIPVHVSLHPTKIPTLSNILTVYAFEHTAFAVDQEGSVFGWGAGWYHFGIGPDEPDRSTPEPVAGVTSVRSLALNEDVILALKRDGTVIGWGHNYFGFFGDGSSTPKPTPQPVPGLSGIIELVSNQYSSFYALKADGTVLRWGMSPYYPSTPQPIANLPLVRHISSTVNWTYLYTQDGRVLRYGLYEVDYTDITTHFNGALKGIGTDTTTTFGGAPYCTYHVSVTNLEMSATVDQNNISASLASTVTETADSCPYPPIPINTHFFSGVGTINNGVITNLQLNPSSTNGPQDVATFTGQLTSAGRLNGTLTIKRTDIGAPFDWTVQSQVR